MNESDRRIKGLGEVSIRVRDLDAMQKFYEEVVGLEVTQARGKFCVLQDRRRLWRPYAESGAL